EPTEPAVPAGGSRVARCREPATTSSHQAYGDLQRPHSSPVTRHRPWASVSVSVSVVDKRSTSHTRAEHGSGVLTLILTSRYQFMSRYQVIGCLSRGSAPEQAHEQLSIQLGDHFPGHQLQVLQIGHVQHLQVHTFRSGLLETADLVHQLCRTSCQTVLPQLIRCTTDTFRTAGEFRLVAPHTQHLRGRIDHGYIAPCCPHRIASTAKSLRGLLDRGKGHVVLVGVFGGHTRRARTAGTIEKEDRKSVV